MNSNQTISATPLFSIKHSFHFRKLRVFIFAWIIGVVILGSVAQAAEVPGFDTPVAMNAREQPVDQFLEELFGQLGVPSRISGDVSGSVNGDFRKSARDVFHDISSSFQLSAYYDGAIAHIHPSSDFVHNILYMPRSKAQDVAHMADKMGITDNDNNLSVTDVGLAVTGAPEFVNQIEEMSAAMRKDVDVVTNSSTPPVEAQDIYRTFELRYARADDVSLVIGGETVVVPGVATTIRSLIEPGAVHNQPVNSNRIAGSSILEGLRGRESQAANTQPVSEESNTTSVLSGATGSVDNGNTANTRIVADPLSNSIVIRDKATRMPEYAALIKSLDKEPKMIDIEATIIDLNTEKLRELGINWRLQREDGKVVLGDGTVTDELIQPNTYVTPQGDDGFMSLLLESGQQFISRIRALETKGAARIVSKSQAMTLSNVEALFDTTSTYSLRVEGQEEADLFNVSVGSKLRVIPHVYETDGRNQITLRVNIEDGSTSDRSVDGIPVVGNSTISAQAIIDVGQSLLIGGFARETKGNATDRVPVPGRKTSTHNERVFLITPSVTNPEIAGERLSAPVLSAPEATIIQPAPSRLANAEHGPDPREEAHPLERSLPRGDDLRSEPDIEVEVVDQMVVPSDDKRSPQTRPTTRPTTRPVQQPGSLRDRLFALQPPHLDDDASQTETPSVTEAADNAADANEGWQAISSPSAVKVDDVGSAVNARPANSLGGSSASANDVRQPPPPKAVDSDGWQIIN